MEIHNFIIDELRLDAYEFNLLSIFLDDDSVISLSEIEKKVCFKKPKILKTIESLKNKDLIRIDEKISDKEVFETLNKQSCGNGGCLFCGYNKSFLDKHHYPKRAKDGGTSTISICSNCHREFHYMADYSKKYRPSTSLLLKISAYEQGIKYGI